MPHPPSTARLCFRDLVDGDIGNLQRIFADPVAMKYYPSTKDLAETQQWIDWCRRGYETRGHALWVVCLQGTNEFICQCGLVLQNIREQDEIEIGYSFCRSHWGQGYATEAAAACREYGFAELAAPKLVSFINPANEPSKRVATRIGMTLEKALSATENRWQREVCVYSIAAPASLLNRAGGPT